MRKRIVSRMRAHRDSLPEGYERASWDLNVMYAEGLLDAPSITADQAITLERIATEGGGSLPLDVLTGCDRRDVTCLRKKGSWVEVVRDRCGVQQVCLSDLARFYLLDISRVLAALDDATAPRGN